MLKQLSIITKSASELVDITDRIEKLILESKVKEGSVVVYAPHTTAGITINEHADPSVTSDIIDGLERFVPQEGEYAHTEGNSHAHIKASLMGASQTVFINNSKLALGTWQGIFFCEFDGPRTRKVLVKICPDG